MIGIFGCLLARNGVEQSILGDIKPSGQDVFCSWLMLLVKNSCDYFVVFFASWTALVWTIVFLGKGGFQDLLIFSPLVLLPPLLVFYLNSKNSRNVSQKNLIERTSGNGWIVPDKFNYLAIIILLIVLSLVGFDWFWVGAVSFLAVNYLGKRYSSMVFPGNAEGGPLRALVCISFILCCVFVSGVVSRPDSDDGFFLNLAVSALDNPGFSLLRFDGTLDVTDIPLMPAYRIHSFELLLALVASLLRVEPIFVAHVIIPPFAACLVAFAAVIFMRFFLPSKWHLGCLFLMLFWLTMADPHEGYVNYGLVRIFQGKSILFTSVLPLLFVNTVRAYKSPGCLNIAFLAATILTAVGLSSSGLFLAPLLVVCVLFSLWGWTYKSTVRAILPAFSCLVLLPVAIATWNGMRELEPILNSSIIYGYSLTFEYALQKVFGDGLFYVSQMAVLISCWFFIKNEDISRFVLAFTLIFFVTVFNPFLYDFWAKYVTSDPVFFRLFFIYPLPLFFAVIVVSLLCGDSKVSSVEPKLFVFIGIGFVLLWAPKFYTFSPYNKVSFGSPFDLKVPALTYSMAEYANQLAEPDETILVPREIAMWVPTFRGHSKLFAMKENYLKGMLPWIGVDEFRQRIKLFRYISGQQKSADSPDLFIERIAHHSLGVIIIPSKNPWRDEIVSMGDAYNFNHEERFGYIVLSRSK